MLLTSQLSLPSLAHRKPLGPRVCFFHNSVYFLKPSIAHLLLMAFRRDQDVLSRDSITDSPTDGYFNRRQHPRDLYVATPASSIAELEGDTAVRYAGSSDSSPSRSQVIYTPTSTARSGETTPLLERDAPPAYTAVASAPVPAAEKPTAPTSGLFDSARASKREDAGGADDLGESGLPTPTVRRPCCRRPCAASGGTSKRQFLLFVRLFVGIVGTLLLVGLLFPDHRDEVSNPIKRI